MTNVGHDSDFMTKGGIGHGVRFVTSLRRERYGVHSPPSASHEIHFVTNGNTPIYSSRSMREPHIGHVGHICPVKIREEGCEGWLEVLKPRLSPVPNSPQNSSAAKDG